MEERAANGGRLGYQAIVEMKHHLRALGGGIRRIERGSGREGRGSGLDIPAAIQQMPAMEVVFRVIGCARQRIVDCRQRRIGLVQQHLDRG